MRMILYFISILIFAFPGLAAAYDVLVVQDRQSPVYDSLLLGFRSGHHFKERVIVLQDYAENDLVKIIREDHPALVLAVGGKALSESRIINQTPIVSVFTYGIQNSVQPSNLVQIKMQVRAERFAALFHALGAKRVGTVLSAAGLRYAVKAAEVFRKAGITLVILEAKKPGFVAKQLEALSNTADAIWLLPDPAIITSDTVELFATHSMRYRLPLVSFSDAHLKKGAAVAFSIDLVDLGKQAAEVADQIIAGENPEDIEDFPPRKIQLRFNRQVLEHLNLSPGPLLTIGGLASE